MARRRGAATLQLRDQGAGQVGEELAGDRPLLKLATPGNLASGALARALRDEEDAERLADAEYWKPLRERIEHLRRTVSRARKT